MITTNATPVIETLASTFNSAKGLLFIALGVELALFILGKIVEGVQAKVKEKEELRKALKAMEALRAWSNKVGVKLTGDYSPDIKQNTGVTETEYLEMIKIANTYGVKVSDYKGNLLN